MSNDGADGLDIPATKTFNELLKDNEGRRLFLTPKTLDPSKQQGSYVMIYFDSAKRTRPDDAYFNDVKFRLDFLCHKDIWEMDNWKIRPYRLMDVVKSELEGIQTTKAVKGEFNVYEPRLVKDFHYMGYTLTFEITGATSKLCEG